MRKTYCDICGKEFLDFGVGLRVKSYGFNIDLCTDCKKIVGNFIVQKHNGLVCKTKANLWAFNSKTNGIETQ